MKILIVDDHPMTVDGYINTIQSVSLLDSKHVFEKAHNCEDAYNIIVAAQQAQKPFDLAILDYTIPPYEDEKIMNGSDLVSLLRITMPNCKAIMITAHTEILVIYEILKKYYPEGLVVKSDITPENLLVIIKTVLLGNEYTSPRVKECVAEIWKKDLMVEDHNRQILLFMSKGFKIKDINKQMNLCTSAIQKRVILMKRAFNVTDDSGLLLEAKNRGFV
jgi:DNA-binding NarL/FixJ family response regulator